MTIHLKLDETGQGEDLRCRHLHKADHHFLLPEPNSESSIFCGVVWNVRLWERERAVQARLVAK